MAVMRLRQNGRRVVAVVAIALVYCMGLVAWKLFASTPGSSARLREALGGRRAVPIYVQVCAGSRAPWAGESRSAAVT